MTLKFDIKEENELVYTDKFLATAHRNGISIRYATDRAALDLVHDQETCCAIKFEDITRKPSFLLSNLQPLHRKSLVLALAIRITDQTLKPVS